MNQKLFFAILFFSVSPLKAATPIDLSKPLPSFFAGNNQPFQYSKVKEDIDFNQTMHTRISQTYQGYKVWGGDGVVHVSNATRNFNTLSAPARNRSMNGTMYQDIDQDIANTKALSKETVLAKAISLYKEKGKADVNLEVKKNELMIYVDDNNKAHWAYLINLVIPASLNQARVNIGYIIDATNLNVYHTWDNLKTYKTVLAGGHGGNLKTGKKYFDGLKEHLAALELRRDDASGICYFTNDRITIKHNEQNTMMKFKCAKQSEEHNNVFWNGSFDKAETAYSPSNDAMFGAEVAINMFKDWFKIPFLIDKLSKPARINIGVHLSDENAYWDDGEATFGDSVGSDVYNPFTSLDTVVHELGHGFTEQQSDLQYFGQSGGLNESFSDMVGIAAEYYLYGKTDYLVGYGDIREPKLSLRYMDKPSRDCEWRDDECSIDTLDQYYYGLNVHYSSGLYNRVFYLLANSPGWNPRKALSVMVQANRFYWTPTTKFTDAACGVLKAAKDYKYNIEDVKKAFATVKINTSRC